MTGWTGGPGIMTFYSSTLGGETGTTASTLASATNAAVLQIQGDFPTGWTATGDTSVDDIDASTGNLIGTHTVSAWTRTGGSSAGFGPLAVGGCVTWLTATYLGGRRVRGRTFVSPVASEFQDADGTPKSNLLTSLNSFGSAWVGAMGSGQSPVVWHRPVGGSGGLAVPIVSYSVRDKFAVLRSRRD